MYTYFYVSVCRCIGAVERFGRGGVFVVRTFIQYIQDRAKDDIVVIEHGTKREKIYLPLRLQTNKK